MAGLVPAIHETQLHNFLDRSFKAMTWLNIFHETGALAAARVDGRDKPGHDGKVGLSGKISHSNS